MDIILRAKMEKQLISYRSFMGFHKSDMVDVILDHCDIQGTGKIYLDLKKKLKMLFDDSPTVSILSVPITDHIRNVIKIAYDLIDADFALKCVYLKALNEWSFEALHTAILSKSRKPIFSDLRAMAQYVLRKYFGLTFTGIGKAMNRDHTSVLFACGKIEELIELKDKGLLGSLLSPFLSQCKQSARSYSVSKDEICKNIVLLKKEIITSLSKKLHVSDKKVSLALHTGLINDCGFTPEQLAFLELEQEFDFSKIGQIVDIAREIGVKAI